MLATLTAITLITTEPVYLRCSGLEHRSGEGIVSDSYFMVQNYKIEYANKTISYYSITNHEITVSEDYDVDDNFVLASKDRFGPYEDFIKFDRYTGSVEHISKSPDLNLLFDAECTVVDGPHRQLF